MSTNTVLTIEEELFCTRYELEILSGIVNLNMLERWLPGFCAPHTHKEHITRYDWVKDLVKNKTVLDMACGTGFGSFKIATEGNVAKLTACDIDAKTIKYASCRNRHSLIDYQVQNAETFKLDQKFDVVISFETIEHLKNPELFLENVNEVLATNGTFFVSTPISDVPQNNKPTNIYHAVEWGFEKFQEVLSKHFRIEDVLLQLYRFPTKIDNKFFIKGLKKAGIVKTYNGQIIEKLKPFSWDPKVIIKEMIGTVWTGYQIVQCKKK